MKMASQRFCLRWNNHQSNLLSVFDQLLHAETFTDVTLAVDGQYLKAHKMVLSACSPYFNALFINHPEKHPIVILKDVPYSDMKSLLDFMYRGEVSVDQERLTAFLRVAESLRIKGLTEVSDDKPSAAAPTPPPPQLQRIQPYLVQQQQQQQQQQHQRQKSQTSLLSSNNVGGGAAQGSGVQHSLLSSALASMPKRKRGRPRKLSGSSNGTGNDYDEFEREGMLNDSEMGDSKLGNDSFSGNEDVSDDNQRDAADNEQDIIQRRSSVSQSKKTKLSKDNNKTQQNDNENSTSDCNDSDGDNPMDASYMEPQLMLDEYDEPVEFKFDPNATANSPSSQESAAAAAHANITQQQARQQALLLAAQQKHQQQLVEAAAAAAAGGMKMSAVVGTGPMPGTVTLYNSMVSIPKLAPIAKTSRPKVNKRAKLKQNGVSGNGQGTEAKSYNSNDYMDLFSSNYSGGQAKLTKSEVGGSTGSLNVQFPPASKIKLNTSGSTVGEGEAEGSVRDYCTKEVQLINSTPELSQRLFGCSKTNAPAATMAIMVQHNQQQKQLIELSDAVTQHLPTALGLKMRSATQNHQSQHQQQQQQSQQQLQQSTHNNNNISLPHSNSNSLLKQQLRAGLKEIDTKISAAVTQSVTTLETISLGSSNNDSSSCSALQSLANVAERQVPSAIQPPSANNLHHQFLLHMAANPMLQNSGDFFQQQQQQQDLELEQQQQQQQQLQQQCETDLSVGNFDILLDPNDKSEPELTLADESAGLDYKTPEESVANESECAAEAQKQRSNNSTTRTTATPNRSRNTSASSRPVQRRRIRRKAQSSLDDQAEHLTEMSVRGLDLFRYARINEGVYQCTECAKENVQKTFKNKYSFQRHAFLYHEGKHRKVFPCPVCGKEFSRPDKMKNHLKMVHESFVTAKDMNNFNPLNYLITAAAAGEIHSTLFTPGTVATTAAQQQTTAILNSANRGNVNTERMSLTEEGLLQYSQAPASPPTCADDAELQKLHSDIIIKDEIVISPSPSPPPLSMASSPPPAQPHTAARAVPQRLEEVK